MKNKPSHTPKDSHYARLRRVHRDLNPEKRERQATLPEGRVLLYGIHTVREALANPRRKIHRLSLTRNAQQRVGLENTGGLPFPVDLVEPRALDALCGPDSVHQGVVAEADMLSPKPLSALGDAELVLILDQVTDPHNVGAIMRSAVAFGASAIVTTSRHSPNESGVLAKSASGAIEHLDLIEVRNLADALGELSNAGFTTIGLDSDAAAVLQDAAHHQKIALVLGAEGKGLRAKTRETVNVLARLDMPGAIRSLNVSNAAAVALYVVRNSMKRRGE